MAKLRRDLVSQRAREAVRDFMSGTTLREIDELWQDELFAPVFEDPEPVGGQRVTHFQGYLDQVDWTDPSQVTRALRVFESALSWLFDPATEYRPGVERIERLRRLFKRDGYEWTDEGKIVGGPELAVVEEPLLVGITDPAIILDHLDRISRAVRHGDPAQAIGSAKELIESTAKLVLRERGEELSGREEVPDLVRRAQEALNVHPTQAGGPDAAPSVRRILGAASTVATGVAELRNAGYGTGHGHDVVRSGLSARHSRLAINAAKLWCEFILDTLSDERAPWRRNQDPS